MDTYTYWNEIGSQKDFEDPIYIDKLKPFLSLDAAIMEYGCGYGRLLQYLHTQGYSNLKGFDLAPNMIQRGKTLNPALELNLLDESARVPLANASLDMIVLSTVLCCVINKEAQKAIIDEISRLLKPKGVLYFSDFILCNDPSYTEKYQKGSKDYGDWGVYTTSEGVAVRHHKTSWIMELLTAFDIQWFEQFNFKTMNNNTARSFHCIAQKLEI